jgi:tungstate transport system substrate-binding protein
MKKILRMPIVALQVILGTIVLSMSSQAADPQVLTMATTTSTDNTGLLDYLAPKFQAATGIGLRWTATGTGQALKLGENCDVDVLMVHAPEAEKQYVENGFGVGRREFMYNDFVVIGPPSDPAGIKGQSIRDAFKALEGSRAVFASRGDNSGTHQKELSLWAAADMPIPEREPWYIQTGQGMLATINIAAERNGYTLTDRGTYVKYEDNMKGNPPLKILVEGDAVLLNRYSVIAVNPARCPDVKQDLAETFINWITGAEGQQVIGDFKVLGKKLFTPDAAR